LARIGSATTARTPPGLKELENRSEQMNQKDNQMVHVQSYQPLIHWISG